MPLSKDPLVLEPSPRAAADARRWVTQTCQELGRHDLLECARLGVTELVANAVLHAEPPFRVRVRGTASHPRIDVLDGTRELPDTTYDGADLLATFGRGLTMVAMSSVAWGASVERDGKFVWFEPAAELGADSPEGVFELPPDPAPPAEGAGLTVRLVGLDLDLHARTLLQFLELRRELRLLSLAHGDDYPLATTLTDAFVDFEQVFVPPPSPGRGASGPDGARAATPQTGDLEVVVATDATDRVETLLEFLDLADAFCRAQRLLSLQRTPDQRSHQVWYLTEVISQLAGHPPTPWADAASTASSST